MDEFEKVEKLRSRANVSYEEAKEALNATNGDLLDAMIYLEKQGKTTSYSEEKTTRAEDNLLPSVPSKASEKKDHSQTKANIKNFFKRAWEMCLNNDFVLSRKDSEVVRIPVIVFVAVLLLTFHILLPAMIISLFFGCRYRFEGKDDLSAINNAMDKVENAADKVKEEFTK